ncbi:MAG: hypothetical protein ACRC5R_01645 [Mycoplasmatales bacterium]
MRRDKQLEKIIETKTNECIKLQSIKNANDLIYVFLKYIFKSLGEVKIYFKSEIAPELSGLTLCTFTRDYFKIAAKIVKHARKIYKSI